MYQANSPRVAHETLDDETIIIDTQTGYYYTAARQASVVWCALIAGHTPQQVAQAYKIVGLEDPAAVNAFVQELIKAELITASSNSENTSDFAIKPLSSLHEMLFELKCHSDLQELIELDPIHEVDTSQGWPIQNKDNK